MRGKKGKVDERGEGGEVVVFEIGGRRKGEGEGGLWERRLVRKIRRGRKRTKNKKPDIFFK